MKDSRHSRIALLSLTFLALLVAVPIVATWRVVQQIRLNRSLIAAVKRNDDTAVMTLLSKGADANAPDDETRPTSLWRLLYNDIRGVRPKASVAPCSLLLELMNQNNVKVINSNTLIVSTDEHMNKMHTRFRLHVGEKTTRVDMSSDNEQGMYEQDTNEHSRHMFALLEAAHSRPQPPPR